MDAAFVDELLLQKAARHDHDLLSQDSSKDPKLARAQAKRKTAILKWRRGD